VIPNVDTDVNPYSLYLLSSIAELIGTALGHFNDKFKRKQILIVFLLSASLVCLIVAIIPLSSISSRKLQWSLIIRILFALIGKILMTASINSCYVFNSIVFPDKIRCTVLFLTTSMGTIGFQIAPQINLLENLVWKRLPYVIFSSFTVIASICVFFLPEPNKIHF
jgi:MFS family permease